MHTRFDLIIEALHDGPVLADAALTHKLVGFDSHSEMRVAAGARTGMTLMS